MSETFVNASLVLLGHGTELNGDSATPVYQHARELRQRRIFAEVREAFWKQEPLAARVLEEVRTERCFIVPLFISEGYFSAQVIPTALGFDLESGTPAGRRLQKGSRMRYYCYPVGTHERMTAVLLARALGIVKRHPFPACPSQWETTLFIAGHGTEKDERSSQSIERQVSLLRALNLYAEVHAIYMEEEPRIGACYEMASTRNLVVVPFFISDGLHVTEDIPVLLGEPERVVQERLRQGKAAWRNPTERKGKLVWYAPSVGTEPALAEVILERVREALAWDS